MKKNDAFDTKLKEIHIGNYIKLRVNELAVPMERICSFMDLDQSDVLKMYESQSLDSDILLRWSKLLKYDFFRLYSQHLILYAPVAANPDKVSQKDSALPQFRKNVYTQEIINFIMELINKNKMTLNEVMDRYNIPKTTLYRWMKKR